MLPEFSFPTVMYGIEIVPFHIGRALMSMTSRFPWVSQASAERALRGTTTAYPLRQTFRSRPVGRKLCLFASHEEHNAANESHRTKDGR